MESVLKLPRDVVREAGMLELLAAELRIAELEAALVKARAEACTDPLTGALNRRGFEVACRRELARAQRQGQGVALAHIDLDDFKRVNDRLGHQTGDQVLIGLVGFLQQAMRPSDVLCRFGGEEFVLMLPDTLLDDAVLAVQRFLDGFSRQVLPRVGCTLTFSAGVVYLSGEESLEAALRRADMATYAAKRNGKRCVVSG